MRRLPLTFGQVDSVTPDAALPGGDVLRLRDAVNVVAAPDGVGYVVPRLARALGSVGVGRTVIAVFASPLTEPGTDGRNLVVVTSADVRTVTMVPSAPYPVTPEFETAILYTFATDDVERQVQGTRLARGALYLTTTRGDGTAEAVLVVSGKDETLVPEVSNAPNLVVRELVAGLPETEISVTVAAAEFGKGIDPGIYAYRFARRLPDGSVGPATTPVILEVQRSDEVQRPYFVRVAGTRGDTSLEVENQSGTAAEVVGEFEAALAKNGGPVPTMIGGQDVEVVDAALVASQATLYLADPIDADVAFGRGVQFGKGTALNFVRVGPIPTGPDGAGERVVVLLSAPLGPGVRLVRATEDEVRPPETKQELASLANGPRPSGISYEYDGAAGSSIEASFASPYFELGEVTVNEGLDSLFFDGTVGDVLAGRSYREGHLGAAQLRARRVTEVGGRLLFGGIERELSGPNIPGTVALAGSEVIAHVRVETPAGEKLIWTGATVRASVDVTFVPFYPDAGATEIVYFSRPLGDTGVFRRVGTFRLRPLGVLAGAAGTEVTVNFTSALPVQDPDFDEVDTIGRTSYTIALDGATLTTGFARPYEWLAERLDAFSADDGPVLGFVSLGGAAERQANVEYPVLSFWRRAVRGAVLSSTGEVLRWQVIETGRGAVGHRAFTSHGRSVFYVSDDGIRVIGRSAPLSSPVLSASGVPVLGASPLIDATASLAIYQGDGREELWFAAGNGAEAGDSIWVMPLGSRRRPRWTRLERARSGITSQVLVEGSPLGLFGSVVYAECGGDASGSDPERGPAVTLTTAAFSLANGAKARLRRLAMLGTVAAEVSVRMQEGESESVAPGERPSQDWRDAFAVVLTPMDAYGSERSVRYHSRITRLVLATDVEGQAPRVGDRLIGVVFTAAATVRRRRQRTLLS
ncbi:MAG: hypothetical protein Rubg2KO_15520 [Rubricoccaceae bacterium]